MLGLSIGKILLTAAVILAVWQGYKWVGRAQRIRDAARKGKRGGAEDSSASGAASTARADDAPTQDMAPCPRCGVYVVAGASHTCGGDDNAARPG
ncbi:MAG: hypothetical protein ACYYKD_03965 [Rhodospirillales bacterium]